MLLTEVEDDLMWDRSNPDPSYWGEENEEP